MSYNQFKCVTFQNYNNYLENQRVMLPNICRQNRIIQAQQCALQRAQNEVQRRYTQMSRNPQNFPIISSTKYICLTPEQQRQYSNMWWRRYASQMSTGTNLIGFGATAITGSEVPFTN